MNIDKLIGGIKKMLDNEKWQLIKAEDMPMAIDYDEVIQKIRSAKNDIELNAGLHELQRFAACCIARGIRLAHQRKYTKAKFADNPEKKEI